MKKPKWSLEWNDEMSVGIPEIDGDHKRFISLINGLNLSITERMRASEIKKRLQLIVEDAERHFEQEENFFREWQYPDTGGHAHSHSQILDSLKTIQDSFMPYGLEAEWLDAALIIKAILIRHILTEDMQYANYFKSPEQKLR